MPWRGIKDAYRIWLSEIMLQQTRVEQGLPYYEKFVAAFPTVHDLAAASEQQVLRLWQGLGYYSRARNLHTTAKQISHHLGGTFPDTYNEIIRLKGVGVYTAAAISSFAFGEKKAVVDGNVIRVLSRVFGIVTPFDTTAGKRQLQELADELIDEMNPGLYNQAIMDFGSVQCTSQKPNCASCPMKKFCIALAQNKVTTLPVRSKKVTTTHRYFHYAVIRHGKSLYIRQRTAADVWRGLYEFPMVETKTRTSKTLKEDLCELLKLADFDCISESRSVQQLSHRTIHSHFLEVVVPKNFKAPAEWVKVRQQQLEQYPFSKNIIDWMKMHL